MKECTNCGALLSESDATCRYCAHPVTRIGEEPASAEDQKTSAQPDRIQVDLDPIFQKSEPVKSDKPEEQQEPTFAEREMAVEAATVPVLTLEDAAAPVVEIPDAQPAAKLEEKPLEEPPAAESKGERSPTGLAEEAPEIDMNQLPLQTPQAPQPPRMEQTPPPPRYASQQHGQQTPYPNRPYQQQHGQQTPYPNQPHRQQPHGQQTPYPNQYRQQRQGPPPQGYPPYPQNQPHQAPPGQRYPNQQQGYGPPPQYPPKNQPYYNNRPPQGPGAYPPPPGYVQPQYPPPMGPPEAYRPISKDAAAVMAMVVGCFGVHKFYMGKTGQGVLHIVCTLLFWWVLFAPFIFSFVEGIIYLTMDDNAFREKYCRRY